jgi:hypothetical protein
MTALISMYRRDMDNNEGYMQIEIEDEVSGNLVCSVEVPFADFTRCLTSCNVKAKFDFMPTDYTVETIGKVRITENVVIPWDQIGKWEPKKDTEVIVLEHFAENYGSEWHMQSTGTRSQQNSDKGHKYTIKKFVSVDSDEGKERLTHRF